MRIIGWHTDPHGRRCAVVIPEDLTQLESLFLAECQDGEIMETMTRFEFVEQWTKKYKAEHPAASEGEVYAALVADPVAKHVYAGFAPPAAPPEMAEGGDEVRPGDRLVDRRDHYRREHSAEELIMFSARKQIEVLTKQAMDRDRSLSYEQADAQVRRLSPDVHRQSMGVGVSVEEAMRRAGDGDVVVGDGMVNYVLHDFKAKPPGLKAKAQTADQAKKELWRRAQELSKMSPADGMLMAVLERPELLEIIQSEREE